MTVADFFFYLAALITLASGCYAVFTRNIVRAVFSLLGTFFGVAVLFGFLAADFVAVIQVLVYVGGILVLMLFAVMLTSDIETAERSARSRNLLLGLAVGAGLVILLVSLATQAPWLQAIPEEFSPTTKEIGSALLTKALLPFEVVSVLLLGVVIGAVVIARLRRGKEADP